MSDHHASPEYYHGLIKKFKAVGYTLIIATLVTVGIDYFVEKYEVSFPKALAFAKSYSLCYRIRSASCL